MSRIGLAIIALSIIGVIVLGTACNTTSSDSKSHVEDELPEISDSAKQYDFPSDNILKYKGMIIDKDFIIYVFGPRSKFIDALNSLDDVKVWTEFYNDSKRNTTNEWKLVQNILDWYLIIYCDASTYDLEAGIVISNYLNDDGHTYDYDKGNMTWMSIRNLEEPSLLIRKISEDWEQHQYLDNGTWSEAYEKIYINFDL